ncbi:MAG: hypothetical protein LW710_02740 [Burkholderiales bacterium]|jgi:hypothetical protein|uniref:hypothetical protein n=1 Tax=Limnobacter sp. TaxID=2003368 RepID=UPI00392A3A6E|nr:hypothetical protein [Burkholderiales bacterium]
MTISSASAFAILSAAVFLLVGLFSGLSKFLQMWRSTQGLGLSLQPNLSDNSK